MYLLDSNILIEHLAGRFDLATQLRTAGQDQCAIPTISVYELLHGAMRAARPTEVHRTRTMLLGLDWIPFDGAAAEAAARIRFELERAGNVIGPHDLMIAAIAVAHDYVLVTHNIREFSRVAGLKIEDWEENG